MYCVQKPNSTSGTVGTNGVGYGTNSPTKSLLKGGMVYSCIDHTTNMLGPGYYNLGESLVKKSHNVRVSSGNSVRSSSGKSRGGSGGSSPIPSSSSLPQQRNRMFSEEYSSRPNSAAPSPRKVPLNEQTDTDTPKKNVLRGGSNSTSAASSPYSRQPQDQRQHFVYETPT